MSIFKRKKGDKAVPNMHENLLKDVDTTGMTEDQIAALEAEAVLQKYDRESSYRNRLSKPLTLFTAIILIAFSVFSCNTSNLPFPTQLLRAIPFALVLFWYTCCPGKKGLRKDMIPWYDWARPCSPHMVLYIPLNFEHLVKKHWEHGSQRS